MRRVYFLGAGATKADFPNAPLNDQLINFALNELLINGIQEHRKTIEDFLKTFFFKLLEFFRIKSYLPRC